MSLFSHLNPVPTFPPYSGPYSVGTTDVEIEASQLPLRSPTPDPSVSTVNFRIFYPCEPSAKRANPVYWLPQPQQEYLSAYFGFLGVSQRLSFVLR